MNKRMPTQTRANEKIFHVNVCSTDERNSKSVHKINHNLYVSFMYNSKSKSVYELVISVNKSEVKDKKDEEPAVTDIEVIKALGYYKLFECGKYLFNKLATTYKHACMASVKENYWSEFHHVITNYNGHNDTPLSNVN